MLKTNIGDLTIKTARELLEKRDISPTELVSLFLKRIEEINPEVQAWVTVEKETAFQRARELEESMKDRESLPPLFGIPYGAKDIICTKGVPTEAGSNVLKGFIPGEDATIIKKLHQSGAIMLGKTTTTEFANWGGTPNTRNAWNLNHTPGGSSSGSAAGLASGMSLMTLGTQTAGSLSRPAAYNGLTVLKATYGRISKKGVFPASTSLDHVGAFTKTVEDTVLVYNQLSGPDEEDEATWKMPKQELRIQENRELKIGIVEDPYFEADEQVTLAYEEAVKELQNIGFRVKKVKMPKSFLAANAAQAVVMQAETAHYHASNYHSNKELFGKYLQDFIREGLKITADNYLDAQTMRTIFRKELQEELFSDIDVLVTPATPTPAPEGIAQTGSPAFNLPFTNAGIPTLVLPTGFVKMTNLPVAFQLASAPLKEQHVIDVGYMFQRVTDWHLQTPALSV
ncbi:amidase [Bacillus weihaiensis]|uniref:Amidase n=1 Tax=Bacillus weihaiensis TaxID=1547283 RepID=A0A1L3MX35_9BACI|nr:amidase [Bacillus weihaiensis]APH06905.1 amidase [Bacillus weihaiensis]